MLDLVLGSMIMISKWKRRIILSLESPLIIIVFILKIVVAIVAFIFIRIFKKGWLMGSRFDKVLEWHEQGNKKR